MYICYYLMSSCCQCICTLYWRIRFDMLNLVSMDYSHKRSKEKEFLILAVQNH